jgi:hypothetical protein
MAATFAIHEASRCRFHVISLLLGSLALASSGCSAAKPPAGILSNAELDVRAATEARADDLAPMDLQSAREKLVASRKAMQENKYEDARRLAESAQVEAELATAKAEAEIARRTADSLRHRLDPLRSENERAAKSQPAPAASKE